MIVAVHQPQYLPWLGYFDKIRQADCFCFLDDVQYKKNEWQNRNRIKTANGWQWLTVPVRYRFGQKINQVRINDTVNWPRKHLQALHTNYAKAPFFSQYIGLLEHAYQKAWDTIEALNIYLIETIRNLLDLDHKPAVRSSEMQLRDQPSLRLVDICKLLGADTYLAGAGGAAYMDLEPFRQNGIEVIFQKFAHPVYPQLYGPFQSHLSILDLLFNCGPESPSILAGKRK